MTASWPEIDAVTPWAALAAELEPFYPRGKGRGRPPIGLERMLRMYVAQQCFGLSDEGIEDAIYDSQSIRRFVGIDLGREDAPDATTLLKFRRLLETHELTRKIFETINWQLGEKECLLTMHPEKSKIVYCKDSNRKSAYPTTQFTLLGFTFRPRDAWGNNGRRLTSFLPGASNEALKRMRQRTRSWNIQRKTPASLLELSKQYNATLRGWWNYYGAFYKTVMRKVFNHFDLKLHRWARQKYKPLAGHKRRSADWLNRMKKACPSLFVHWHVFGNEARLGNGSRMS